MKNFFVFLLLLSILGLEGCQEAPKEKVVISKAEGLPEHAVLEQSFQKKEIEAPKVWSQEISKNDGAVTISAEQVSLQVPDIFNTPITERESASFGDEELQAIVEYFKGENELCRISEMSKAEIEEVIEKIAAKEGMYGSPDSSIVLNASSRQGNLKKLLQTAPPERKAGEQITEIAFGKYEEDAYGYSMSGGAEEDLQEVYGDDFFWAEVVMSDGLAARINATKCNPEKGLLGGFLYAHGGYVGESLLEKKASGTKADNEWEQQYKKFLEQLEEKLTEETFSQEKGVETAKNVLEDLSITGMDVGDVEKVFWTPTDTRWDNMDVDWENGEAGYKISFGISLGGLISYCQPHGTVYPNLGEGVYNPSFSTEMLEMVVTEKGVKLFLWKNMTQEKKVIAENTQLLSFDKIAEALGKHMMAVKVSTDNLNHSEAKDISHVYHVIDVELRSAFIPAYEAPENAWLAPVWVFRIEGYTINHLDGDKTSEKKAETVLFNAIDGGYVTPVMEMDFFS